MKTFFKYLMIATLALGVTPAIAAIWQWSLTPASNGTADPTINWAVGMAPSAVDPSARAMMARIAEWRDDTSGALVTGGTATAYTVTTNQSNGGNGICTGSYPINGTQIVVTMNVTNGASPYLTVDGCNALPLASSGGVFVPTGYLQAGSTYRLTFNSTYSNWILQNYASSIQSIGGATGVITLSTGLQVVSNALSVVKATAANYFAAASNTFLSSDIVFSAEVTFSPSATPTYDFSTFLNGSTTMTSNITSVTMTNLKAGQAGMITYIQPSSGGPYTLPATFNSNFKFPGGVQPVLSTTANAVDIIFYSCRSATFCAASLNKAFN